MDADVRITVLKRSRNDDLLCSWAWCDIHKYVVTLARGGNFLGVKPGIFVTCCTDGFRPVFFKLKRIEP